MFVNAGLLNDVQLRYSNGWFILALTSLCILANLLNVITNMAFKIKIMVSRFLLERARKMKAKIYSSSSIKIDDTADIDRSA